MVGKGLDPIFAQGSAPGQSAIAVVRLSGKLPASLYDELKIYEDERSFFLREINFRNSSIIVSKKNILFFIINI